MVTPVAEPAKGAEPVQQESLEREVAYITVDVQFPKKKKKIRLVRFHSMLLLFPFHIVRNVFRFTVSTRQLQVSVF